MMTVVRVSVCIHVFALLVLCRSGGDSCVVGRDERIKISFRGVVSMIE